jgi:ATP-dependent exoDNAse (exonuclease V) beta subunit
VWWDPGVLNLEVEEGAPIRHRRLLEAEGGGVESESERDYVAWKEAKAELVRRAAEPSLVVQTLTSAARHLAKSERANVAEPVKTSVRVEYVGRDQKDRPAGRRFGALVHAVLATVDFAATSDAIRKSAVGNGRLLGATDVEIDSAVHTVASALQHPILQRAAAARSSNVRRETPVLLRREDGSLTEGVVDLAFREDTIDFSGWTIVDFKTDREFGATSAQYEFQVALYADAVAVATRLATRGILLIL